MEVFRHAGSLWNVLTGKRPAPHFEVTTASADGRAVCCDGQIRIRPNAAIAAIRKTDLIFIPTTGLSLDDVVERNAPVIPWLRRWHKRGAAIASVCSGVGLTAATGMLDGKRATTHWGLAERFPRKVSEGKMDAGIDGHRGQRLLLWRRRARSARSQPISGRGSFSKGR